MVLKVGHRGAAYYEPENTLRSFKRALELGVDFVELDVRQTKDGVIVVLHDATVNRTTNGKGYLRNYSFSDLRFLDAGKGEKVPSLEEVAYLTKDKCGLFIEVKETGFEDKLVDFVKKQKLESKSIVISFHLEILQNIKRLYPELRLGVITDKLPKDYLVIAKSSGFDYALVRKDKLRREHVDGFHSLGMKVYAWTVDDERWVKKLMGFGVDAIASNKPDILTFK
ncbi:hypothetical protein FJZ53_02650 [Candidatus Woesearchaeota archaeon]|nr:hypothetical protein [Candidatus Woesearchaeota archaeon]